MSPAIAPPARHWWERRGPSALVLVLILGFLGWATWSAAHRVADVLPEVPRDRLGDDTWGSPLGLEQAGNFELAHIPDCAAGSVTRIVLWDANSKPYWEVSGPATPMASFVVGVAPTGFEVGTEYREPPPGEVLRLVAFRKQGAPVGIRYKASQLRVGRVVAGNPLDRFTPQGFQTAAVCGQVSGLITTTTTTVPG